MSIDDLKAMISSNTPPRDKTLAIWLSIYLWIQRDGFAEMTDYVFVGTISKYHSIRSATLGNHLRRMTREGLIEAHTMRFIEGGIGMLRIFDPFDHPATSHLRYVLPGGKVPLFHIRSRTSPEERRKLLKEWK